MGEGPGHRAAKILLAGSSTLLALAGAEWGLRVTGAVASWSEQNGGAYQSPFGEELSLPYRLTSGDAGSVFTFGQTEFDFQVRLNRHGLRDIDPPPAAQPGDSHPREDVRLLFLGDSFTMGQGASFEGSYPQQFGRLLSERHPTRSVRILQAGVSGSDPIFAFELLSRSLLAERPDWVILAINGSDIDDVVARGGRDRFDDHGQLRSAHAPWWEVAFARSHLVRAVAMKGLGYNWFLLRAADMLEAEERARQQIERSILAMAALGIEHHFRLVVVSHPFVYEVRDRRPLWVSKFAPLYDRLRANGVVVIDLYDFFRAEVQPAEIDRYFWPLDQHCTQAGYQVFARGVLSQLSATEGFPR